MYDLLKKQDILVSSGKLKTAVVPNQKEKYILLPDENLNNTLANMDGASYEATRPIILNYKQEILFRVQFPVLTYGTRN